MEVRGLRLTASRSVKEKRLAALLQQRGAVEASLREAVLEAQARGSLGLAGRPVEQALASYVRAQRAVDPAAPFTVEALKTWRQSLAGDSAFRTAERTRTDGPPPAPPRFVEARLEILAEWLNVESSLQLKPGERAALAMVRLLEILPFPDGNGLVARLAASHLMVSAGARPPILAEPDGARLDQALLAAFQLQTEPLAVLLDEAAERAVDVMIAAVEGNACP